MLLNVDVCACCSYDLFIRWRDRWKQDGLSSLHQHKYSVVSKVHQPLYTLVTVDIGQPPALPPIDPQAATQSLYWSVSMPVWSPFTT